jgi:hypothetical protein
MTNQENQLQELLSSPEEMLDLEKEQLEAVIGGTGCCPTGLFRTKKIAPEPMSPRAHADYTHEPVNAPVQSLRELGPRDRLRAPVQQSRSIMAPS